MVIRIALAQIGPVVGDIDGNVALIEKALGQASEAGAQVVVLPELAITGYPPEDLLLKRSFVKANLDALEHLTSMTDDALAVIGFVDERDGKLFNAAAVAQGGRFLGTYRKHLLPNYGVFDEARYFERGTDHLLIETDLGVIGVCVCEDAWSDTGPVIAQGDAGAQVVLNLNASPFHKNKLEERTEMLAQRAKRANASIAYVNAAGAQDELVFDGGSLVIGPDGSPVARWPQFQDCVAVVDAPLGEARGGNAANIERVEARLRTSSSEQLSSPPMTPALGDEEEVYRALSLCLKRYADNNGFEKIVVGLSGGIDSTLTVVIAADALGPDAVLGVAMPSQFSSSHSVEDARALAENLGIHYMEIPIAPVYETYLGVLDESFGAQEMGLAEENLQARIRGMLLMTISNRYGHLVIATGNKSEMACGYATLYGDMAGGFALLKDVFKTEVYALSRYRNEISKVIPERVLTKAPSAELRHDQKDSDSLPPYEVLDPILEGYIEDDASIDDLVSQGHDRATVERVIALVDRAEYKRRQAPPGPKVTTKAFGRDRRLPITNMWRERST